MEKWKVTDVMEYFLNHREKFIALSERNIHLEVPINKEDVYCWPIIQHKCSITKRGEVRLTIKVLTLHCTVTKEPKETGSDMCLIAAFISF